MRISDWSSDVCSSDLPLTVASFLEGVGRGDAETARAIGRGLDLVDTWYRGDGWYADGDHRAFDHYGGRSEERRVGKECVSSVDLGGRGIIKKKKIIQRNLAQQITANK